ncbi:MAG: A/G-specific adenine glycosylase [Rubricoccaceae bacterium]|nr:A/G-specific adenine glycosylase [Rubricoccaceae bacterium]
MPERLPNVPIPRISPDQRSAFRRDLIEWFEGERRDLPWRELNEDGRRDPYRVWISEIMLQQTRVDQVMPYFERFIKRFPDVTSLADASLDDVLKTWEGLGYYARARNLHKTALQIVHRFDGRFPDNVKDIKSLPGIGAYTSAAILSLAFGQPFAVLDGNVIRVLSRVFAVDEDVRATRTRRLLQAVADKLIDPNSPGAVNEALMELGATICSPRKPLCSACPLSAVCLAYRQNLVDELPFTSPRKPVPHYHIAVGIVRNATGEVLIQKRPENAMLGGLWEFPGGKQEENETPSETCKRELYEEVGLDLNVEEKVATIHHAYSHFTITLHAFECETVDAEAAPHSKQPIRWVAPEDLDTFAFPRANQQIVEILQHQESPREMQKH